MDQRSRGALALTAARRLHSVAASILTFISVVSMLAIAGAIVVVAVNNTAQSSEKAAVLFGVIGGVLVQWVGVMFVCLWAQAYARDLEMRADYDG